MPDDLTPVVGRLGYLDRAASRTASAGGFADGLWAKLRPMRWLLLIVFAPTVLTAFILYFVVADQYVSESHFLVRSAQEVSSPTEQGLGAILGIGQNSGQAEAHSISDYLMSLSAVDAVSRKLDLVSMFRRPEADWLTRLHSSKPAPETLFKYFKGQVAVNPYTEDGVATLRVRAYRPEDAYQLNKALLELSEARVNELNQRAQADSLAAATRQLIDAENGVAVAQKAMTAFRQGGHDLDPAVSGSAGITMATSLQAELARARAQLAAMGQAVRLTSPEYVAMASQVRALEGQVNAAQARLAGGQASIAPGLGEYEALKLRQDFAAKRYEYAAQALQASRARADKQQLFVTRVVDPNMPVKSIYPERFKTLATELLILLVGYALGSLVVAGMREHAA